MEKYVSYYKMESFANGTKKVPRNARLAAIKDSPEKTSNLNRVARHDNNVLFNFLANYYNRDKLPNPDILKQLLRYGGRGWAQHKSDQNNLRTS